ncbi:TPA: Cys-Gln thioester bond-forming surface protein, partial [Clostridium perfringens]|nr:Cys-Gln thioester bond-forming surface protein [Clostridium perfringens]HAT4359428.1 Cys-Gln thioester bond-forming surface protein [Clostridium perfringens]
MRKKKRFQLITAITLVFTFILTNIKVFAVEINSTAEKAYLNYHSLIDGRVKPIGHDRYYTNDLTACYCLNVGAESPTGQDYTEQMPNDPGLETIIYWGYPAKDGSQFGLTKDQYRYATQLAIWAYEREAGINRGIDRTRLQDGIEPASKFMPAINFLVEKAKSREMPVFFEVTPNNIVATQEGDYFVSEPIKIKSDYSFDNATVRIKDTSNPELEKDIIVKDMEGNVKTSGYKANESFRVYIPIDAETGNLKVNVKARVDIPAMLSYVTPVSGTQDMAVADLDTNAMERDGIEVSWTGINGAIELIKKGDDGSLLTGAKFVLKDKGGNRIAEAISENGKAVFNDVKPGEYTIEEVAAPLGYLIANPVNVTVKPNKVAIAEMTDIQIKGRIQVLKVDEETGEPLEGAEFDIIDKTTGQVVESMVSKADGKATSGLLPFRNYIVKETKAPNKYVLNGKEYEVSITEHMKTIEITHANRKIKGRVSIHKIDEEMPELSLKGAVLGIYDDAGNEVDRLTTDEKGAATSKYLDYGHYIGKELQAPEGYKLSDKTIDINITEDDKVYSYDFTNKVMKGRIQIVKVDSENEEKPVANAGFKVVAVNVNGIEPGTTVDKVKTDENGFAFTKDLRYGVYKFIEDETPEGYWASDKEYTININEDNKVYVKYVKNSPIQAKLRVVKVDSKDNKPLEGVKFQVRNTDTNKLVEFTNFVGIIPNKTTTLTTDKNGEIITPQHLAYGNYQLEEAKPKDGYISIKPIPFKIDENAVLEDIKDLGTVYTIKVSNDRITGDMELLKIDSETKKPLADIEFKVTALDGLMKGQTWDLKSNDKGIVSLKGLEYGHYKIEEVKTLWNYVINKEPIFFDVKENGQVIKLEMENKKIRANAELIKVDSETKRPLEGAEFELWNGEKLVGNYTTNKDGKIIVENLEAGNYYFNEIKAPDHYEINQDQDLSFVIDKDNETKTVTAENKVKTGEVDFTKTDVTNG